MRPIAAADSSAGESETRAALVSWLMCKLDIRIPASADIEFFFSSSHALSGFFGLEKLTLLKSLITLQSLHAF